jgi:pantoate--beta-alanine ligase
MMAIARELRLKGNRVGLVPTRGSLHEGSLSLCGSAREICDTVVASIVYGPQSANETERHELARDAELAFTRGVDLIFAPAAADLWPVGLRTSVVVEGLGDRLEGGSRPGHFREVTTIVAKLLNITDPAFVFFGRKDAQQVILIKRMVRELAIDVEVVVGPVVREEDGLALSSDNARLSTEERKAATVIRRALDRCRTLYSGGERDGARLTSAIRSIVEAEPLVRIDYIALTDTTDLEPIESVTSDKPVLVSLAIFVEEVRLTDNLVLNGDL